MQIISFLNLVFNQSTRQFEVLTLIFADVTAGLLVLGEVPTSFSAPSAISRAIRLKNGTPC